MSESKGNGSTSTPETPAVTPVSEPPPETSVDKGSVFKTDDRRYAPPYPQDFYPWWPKHALKAGIPVLVILFALIVLAYLLMFPSDVNMPPLPDEGAYIPGPEWYLMVIYMPFWYFSTKSALLPVFTFWAPLLILFLLVLMPFVLKKTADPAVRMKRKKRIALCASVWFFALLSASVVFGSGSQTKVYGCLSCHNVYMGVRQALPPSNIAEYYRNERQNQIDVGKYRAGKSYGGKSTMSFGDYGDFDMGSFGADQSYKDANWQLRHMYEPTLTW